jgi:isopentenyl-diphosphate delta-isomerase
MSDIVCVDAEDRPVGVASKLAAHTSPGRLHRAFSVMLVDGDGRLLLQRRAGSKYHFGGLWANSCCGHPPPGVTPAEAAARRTFEELGVRPTGLVACGTFVYSARDAGSGLVEREFDHVFVGGLAGEPAPSRGEVSHLRRVAPSTLAAELAESPSAFVPWLPKVLELVSRHVP